MILSWIAAQSFTHREGYWWQKLLLFLKSHNTFETVGAKTNCYRIRDSNAIVLKWYLLSYTDNNHWSFLNLSKTKTITIRGQFIKILRKENPQNVIFPHFKRNAFVSGREFPRMSNSHIFAKCFRSREGFSPKAIGFTLCKVRAKS